MKFKLEIELGNDAMRRVSDIVWALTKLAKRLPIRMFSVDHPDSGKIMDINGNTVGKWEVVE